VKLVPRIAAEDCAEWAETLAAVRSQSVSVPTPWADLFGPLASGSVDDLLVVAQLGQSLDGRVATLSGHSHYINEHDGLDHLHRLRALVDAVVIGVGTACADDPQLTVRRVAGPHPARIVIDPNGRLPPGARVLNEDGIRRIVVRAEGVEAPLPSGVETIAFPSGKAGIAPKDVLAALAARGLRRVLIEGGAKTISLFLAAGCLDRLHVVVAPIILGSGAPGITLPPVERVDQALRPRTRTHVLRNEVLFDCDLSDQRVVVGRAKKST
jgi:riboflavin-specific deaminase-like protein